MLHLLHQTEIHHFLSVDSSVPQARNKEWYWVFRYQCMGFYLYQEPITRSLHLCCTLESTLSNEELFSEQAFPRKSIVSEDVNINENDWAAHWLVDWLLRIRAWKILRTDWLIGYYALMCDKFCPKTVPINNFSSERVDSEGLYGRWRLRVIGSCLYAWPDMTPLPQTWANIEIPPLPTPPPRGIQIQQTHAGGSHVYTQHESAQSNSYSTDKAKGLSPTIFLDMSNENYLSLKFNWQWLICFCSFLWFVSMDIWFLRTHASNTFTSVSCEKSTSTSIFPR